MTGTALLYLRETRNRRGHLHQSNFAGTGPKAIALGLDATGATITNDNTCGLGYDRLVDFDHDSARTGYTGPPS